MSMFDNPIPMDANAPERMTMVDQPEAIFKGAQMVGVKAQPAPKPQPVATVTIVTPEDVGGLHDVKCSIHGHVQWASGVDYALQKATQHLERAHQGRGNLEPAPKAKR